MIMNRYGVAGLDFATVSGCIHLVTCPTHVRGGNLDLMTGVPDVVQVTVVDPLVCSVCFSFSVVMTIAQTLSNLCISRKVFFLKHRVNCIAVCCAIHDLPRRSIWSADNPVEVLNEHFSPLIGLFGPTKAIRVSKRIKPWFDDDFCRAFNYKQEAHL